MVFRLIIDATRRKWHIGVLAVFQMHIIAHAINGFWPSVPGMALTMSGAWCLATMTELPFASRVLYQLPVSRRTWWIARWWMSVVITVVVAQLATSLLQWRLDDPSLGVEYALLSSMFGVLYCGLSMAVRTTAIGKSGDAPGTFLSTVAILPAMVLFVAAPFLLGPYLPRSFADLHAAGIVAMLVMAAITAVGYRHHPEVAARPNGRLAPRLRQIPPVPSGVAVAPRMDPPPAGFFKRLTGAQMVLWEESRKKLITFSTVIAIGIAWWAIGSQYRPWPPLAKVLRQAAMLPFSSLGPIVTEPMIFGFLLIIGTFADVWMITRIRSLRTLPVSSTRLGSLPVVLGLVSAGALWIVLLALHALVLRTLPSSLRPDLFTAFAAVVAMVHTIRFVAPAQPALRSMLGLAPIFIILLALAYIADSTWRPVPPQSAVVVVSLLTLAASWAIMRLALTRTSTMYRPQPAVPTV